MNDQRMKNELLGIREELKKVEGALDTLSHRLDPEQDLGTEDGVLIGGAFCRLLLVALEDVRIVREDLEGLEKEIRDSLDGYVEEVHSFSNR